MRFRATVAYDGTEFYGFQRQGNFRTVQGALETALQRVTGSSVTVLGAGRTDTGVHASGQVTAFDIAWRHDDNALERALNVNLPRDVVVKTVTRTHDGFHPRWDARSRRYEYTAICSPIRQPLRERYAWHVESVLDTDTMNACAAMLIGEHDFAAFGSPTTDSASTVRRVLRAEWRSVSPDTLVFDIEANAFLYRMVRKVTNALVKIGLGHITPARFQSALDDCDPARIKGIAPASGLCLVDVTFDERERQTPPSVSSE
jgi:tRNA pseudouridine38-40 synthase